MLKEVTGDILLSGAKAVCHGISPNDDFHSGLALALRERMPAMYKDFRHYCQTRHPKPGELWVWVSADGRQIVNLFTQEEAYGHGSKPGRATATYVNHALHALRAWVLKERPASLALPRLATGVGGLDWESVRPLLENQLGDLDCTVYVYNVYRPGEKAVED